MLLVAIYRNVYFFLGILSCATSKSDLLDKHDVTTTASEHPVESALAEVSEEKRERGEWWDS